MTELKFNGQHVMRVGQRLTLQTKPLKRKEDKVMTKEEVNDWAARMRDNQRQQAEEQPGSAPPLILEKTTTRQEIEAWYEKPGHLTVNTDTGRESYAPPPVLLKEGN